MKPRLLIPFLAAASLGWISPALAAPVVTNLTASQRAGTLLVDIAYDVAAPGFPSVTVSLEISSDAGATWTVPTVSATGHVGEGVATGSGKAIVWDAGVDWAGNYSTQMRFRVVADDGFALIPGGNFTMGATSGDSDSDAPPVTVTVSAFYLAETETTKAQWDTVRTWAVSNGYTDLAAGAGKAANHPVQTVSWWDVVKWCNARSEKEGLTPVYTVGGNVMRTGTTEPAANWSANGYRLPTEAEWEKAARGRVAGKRFPWGTDTISHTDANFLNSNGETYQSGSNGYHPTYALGGIPYTSPVESFAANGFGVKNMSGNVWEWCWDWYGASYYTLSNGKADPRGPLSGAYRVVRGGGWDSAAIGARCASRNNLASPASANSGFGFRTARTHIIDGFALIPGGGFAMGVTSGDGDAHAPSISVTVSPFYLQQTETTKAQWDEVRTWGFSNGYTDLAVGGGKASNHPVHTVNWWNAVKWCNARSEMEGLIPVYTVGGVVMRTGTTLPEVNWSANGYRLPTEAEWEKAARGGVSGKRFPWGTDTIGHAKANYYGSSYYPYDSSSNDWHPTYNDGTFPYTSPVGIFGANGYGLYDMAGNVGEWCWDWYGSSYYTTSNGMTDPRGPASGSVRMLRGGSWNFPATTACCHYREGSTPTGASDYLGFRAARSSVTNAGNTETDYVTVDTLSDNADLSALTLSSGTLSPTFASDTTSYTADVATGLSSISVTPTRSEANATIQVRVNEGSYTAVSSGSPSGSLALNLGSNSVDVRVTAQDGSTQRTYAITIHVFAFEFGDEFNDSVIDDAKWDLDLSPSNASVVEAGGSLTTTNRGAVFSKRDFGGILEISGTFVLNQHLEHFIVVARSDGEVISGNQYFSRSGISVAFSNDGNTISIQEFRSDGTITILAEKGYALTSGISYSFLFRLDGSNLSLSVDGVEELTAISAYSAGERLGFYSREGFGTSTSVDKILIRADTPISNDPDLSALTLSSGTLSPAFAAGTTTYTASVGNATTSITVTPTRAEANATIEARVNAGSYSPVTSGSPSGSLDLNVGANTIDIRVTAQARNTKTYSVTVTRDKALQTVNFTAITDKTAIETVDLSATGGGSSNPVTFYATGPATINGSNVLSFTGAGSVTVTASQAGDANHHDAPPVTRTFNVTKATATVTLTNLTQTYDGTPKPVGATTNPAGKLVTFTYDDSATAPTNAGFYAAVGTISDAIYQGSASRTLVVAKASQTITFATIADQFATATVNLSATGGGSGNAVTFAVTSGPGSISGGNTLTFSGAGSVTITATQAGDSNHEPATPVARTFTVTEANATVTLSELHQVADGSPRVVIATTDPADLDVAITYGGNPTAPTVVGSYAVVATITDPLYEGSANGTLIVDDPETMTWIEGGELPADVGTYQIARYEVTRSFWNTVRDWAIANGYDLPAIGDGSAGDHPVHSINWYDAIKWCNARTEWENATFGRSLAPAYRIGTAVFKSGAPDPVTILVVPTTSGYRLPSAMEWEFAARGGTASTGQTYAGGNNPDPVAWHAGNSAGATPGLFDGRGTWPAGRKAANELGLYDFSGNVAEWTQDVNPANPSTRLLLGGSWNGAASESAIGALNSAAPSSRLNTSGLRVGRSVAAAMAGALDNDQLTWNSGGNQPWFAQTGTTHDTVDAAESGGFGQEDESWVETTVTGPGNLSFQWKSSSVDGVDVLRFSIGTSESASLTGTVDWQEKTFEIPAGDSVLRWRFARTSPATAGSSRVWLDEVVYTLATEPIITTAPATEVTETTVTLGGEVTDDGGRAITARGVVYATTTAPTLGDSVSNAASGGTGVFSASGTNLAPGTTYHARAYATNAIGTGYGPEITFTTGESADFNNGVATFNRSILPGSRQVFNFTLAGPRIISLSTLGNGALRAELHDSEGNLITSFTGDANFDLEELLLAGDYSLHVFRQADGGPVQTFELTIDASVVAASRPDVGVGASGVALTGNSVYSPANQLASLTSTNLRAVTGYASVANRGKLPDVLAVSGGRGTSFFKVVWSGPTGNITAAMNAGTYRTAEMEEGTTPVSLKATITPDKKKLTKTNKKTRRATIVKKTFIIPLRASSTFAPTTSDAGTIQVKTK